jgi:hypothetical protein
VTSSIIVIVALATVLGSGYGTQSLLARRTLLLNLPEKLALSWLFGAGVISMLIWIFGLIIRGPLLPGLVFCVALVLTWVGWRGNVSPAISFRDLRLFHWFLLVVLAAQVVTMFYLSSIHTLGWDGLLNWEIKARYAYLNNGALPPSYFQDQGRSFSHQEYPLCIPFTQLWLYFWLGETDQYWAKIIFPIFYAAGVVLLACALTRFTGKKFIGFVAAILLFFVPQIAVGGGSAIVGYADFPLSVCYFATVTFLLRSIEEPGCFRFYAGTLALLPWIKRDGVILWLVAATCGALVIMLTRKSRKHFFMLLPGLLVIGLWHGYLRAMHTTTTEEFVPVTLANIQSHSQRLIPIASALLAEFRNYRAWSILWPCVGLGCFYLLWRLRQLRSVILLVAIFAPICLYSATYIFSNWPDYLFHLHTSLGRLLMHVAPLGLVVAGLAAGARLPQRWGRRSSSPICAAPVCERTPGVEFA